MSRVLKTPETTTYAGRCAARLRDLRHKAHLSPDEVATTLGISVNTIYHWERGHSEPKFEMLDQLATLYGLRSPRLVLPEK